MIDLLSGCLYDLFV